MIANLRVRQQTPIFKPASSVLHLFSIGQSACHEKSNEPRTSPEMFVIFLLAVWSCDEMSFVYFLKTPGSMTMKENCSDRVHVLQMDVTNAEQVQKCVEYVKENRPKSGEFFRSFLLSLVQLLQRSLFTPFHSQNLELLNF